MSGYQEPTQEERWQEDNRWAVYPIEKIEAAMARLNEAIVMARAAQREAEARKQQVRAEQEQKRIEQEQREINDKIDRITLAQLQREQERSLDLILCKSCQDGVPRYSPSDCDPFHIYADASGLEACMATPERKQQLREYFMKDIQLGRAR